MCISRVSDTCSDGQHPEAMPELILHHFAASPFSEKLRLILGYKQLSWKSVTVPGIMPKPDVVALTGGYRRTPFLQIGADIYCDTALVCEVLERLQPKPSLYPRPDDTMARILAQWADSTLFWAAVTYNRGPKGAGARFGGALSELPTAIFEDRKAMGFDVEWLQPADAAPAYRGYLQRIDRLLQHQPYLLGPTPSIADFCAYHPLWLVHQRSPAAVDILQHTPALTQWLDRIRAIGHGNFEPIDAAQAIATAEQAEPALPGLGLLPDTGFVNEHGISLGSRVRISAESFGREPTEGSLVAATASHYSLRRSDPRAGVVHVHFPRIGYVLKRVEHDF